MQKPLYYIPFLLLLIACGREAAKDHKDLLEFRTAFWNSPEMMADPDKAAKLDNMYKQFIAEYKEDTLTPVFMYEDAKLHLNVLDNPDQAVVILGNLYNAYPDHRLAPVALFTQAFTYENQAENLTLARKGYQKLIADYPEHPYADQAEVLLKYLGKDPSQILKDTDTDSLRNKENSL